MIEVEERVAAREGKMNRRDEKGKDGSSTSLFFSSLKLAIY